jgi:hypothetical protein
MITESGAGGPSAKVSPVLLLALYLLPLLDMPATPECENQVAAPICATL